MITIQELWVALFFYMVGATIAAFFMKVDFVPWAIEKFHLIAFVALVTFVHWK